MFCQSVFVVFFLLVFSGGCTIAQKPDARIALSPIREVATTEVPEESTPAFSVTITPRATDEPIQAIDCVFVSCERRTDGSLFEERDKPKKDKPLYKAFSYLKEQVTWRLGSRFKFGLDDIKANGDLELRAEYKWSDTAKTGIRANSDGDVFAEFEFRW